MPKSVVRGVGGLILVLSSCSPIRASAYDTLIFSCSFHAMVSLEVCYGYWYLINQVQCA
ncbi:hypothetical protein BGX38DRAFT_1204024 [Terfezia claveryi]|nr:hypothetical protein BGX38DRAFT_1204024 [Terfezia claveryi]